MSGTVIIAPEETTGKIEIAPIDDRAIDEIETVTLTLNSATNGYLIDREHQTAYLAIADNEGNPNLAKILNEPNFKDQWYLNNTEDNLGTPGVESKE